MKVLRRISSLIILTLVSTLALGVPPASAAYAVQASTTWAPTNGRVYAMVGDGDRVYLGGTFTHLRNPATGQVVERQRLAALDADTGELVTGWNPGANGTVRALGVDSAGTVYAGGDFTTVAGGTAQRLAAITATGSRVSLWSASANNTVRDIVVHADGLYVSGAFTSVNGAARVGVARLDPVTGGLVTSWNARVTLGRVWALAPSNDGTTMLLGGSFKALSGQQRMYLGSVSLATGAVTAWAPPRVCDNCPLLDLTTADTSVYAAVGGPGGGRAASWNGVTGARRWIVRADGDVQCVDVHDGVVYAGGHFGPQFDGQERHQFATLDAANGDLLDFQLPLTGPDAPGLWAVIADNEALRIAGAFTGVRDSAAARYASFPTL